MKVDEHRLYKALSQFIINWMKVENEGGRKPYQSEVIGALDMVKTDWYLGQHAHIVLKEELYKVFKQLEGKNIEIRKDDGGIIIANIESGLDKKVR
jgi:hypothetical protein